MSMRVGDEGWAELVALSKHPNVHVKVSGWFRHGPEECGPATLELLEAYGEGRLMFGTDFPWVMGEGEAGYAAQWQVRTNPLPPAQIGQSSGLRLADLLDRCHLSAQIRAHRSVLRSPLDLLLAVCVQVFDAWAAENLTAAQTEALAGTTAARVFGFDDPLPKL